MKLIIDSQKYKELGQPDLNQRIKCEFNGFIYSGLIVAIQELPSKNSVCINLWQAKKNKKTVPNLEL